MPLVRSLRVGATLALVAAVGCLGARSVRAAEPGYEVQVGVVESDNIDRVASGATDQTIAFQEVDFTWHEKRPLFDVDIDGDLSHLSFIQNAYGDEYIGNFIGTGKINLAPEVLSWEFADNFGQTPLNPLEPITPNNVQNINYFATGPVLTLPLDGRALQLVGTAQYGRVDYQELPLDSNRLTGAVALLHEMSPVSNISFNVKDEHVAFQNDELNPDYDVQELYGRYDLKGSRTELGVDLGYGHLHMSGAGDGSAIVRLDVTRKVSPNSTVGLSFGHDYSDGADSFLLIQAVGGATLNAQNAVQAAAPFLVTYATLAWNYEFDRTTLGLTAAYFRNDYQLDEALNNDLSLGSVSVKRQITPGLQLALTEYLDREHFAAGSEAATEADTSVQLTWHVGRNLSVFLAYYLLKGISDFATDKFTENRVWLSIGYGRAAEVPAGPAPVRLPGQQQQ